MPYSKFTLSKAVEDFERTPSKLKILDGDSYARLYSIPKEY